MILQEKRNTSQIYFLFFKKIEVYFQVYNIVIHNFKGYTPFIVL